MNLGGQAAGADSVLPERRDENHAEESERSAPEKSRILGPDCWRRSSTPTWSSPWT
jgi:hypothetical protein